MKNSIEIVNLPIICISDGSEIGSVKSLVINPDKGSIDFITIEKEDWQVSVKAIPFKKVIGVGEYALTVESDSAVIDLNEIPIANQLVNKKIKIIGTKVMTRKGELIGDVVEYFVDEENGQILGIAIKGSNQEAIIAASSVITYGKDIIIVKENASSYFLDAPEQLVQDKNKEAAIGLFDDVQPTHKDSIAIEKNETIKNDSEEQQLTSTDPLKDIKDYQYELLKGKVTTKDLLNIDGTVLIAKGTKLGHEEISKAQQRGASMVAQLLMNVEGE